jgi:hypothetical protein
MNLTEKISRRSAIAGLGTGLATVAVSPVLAYAGTNATLFPGQTIMDDPTTKYPKPPFKEQKQPWPGLASKMEPKPDHGEQTYKGSGRLVGRKALITGGDSGMGRACAMLTPGKVQMLPSTICQQKNKMPRKLLH